MKIIISNIGVFLLTAMVVFSSVSFTVAKHLCGGQVYSESIFGKPEKCGMNDDDCELEANNPLYSEKSCCEDEIKFINGSIFEKESSVKLNNKQQQDLSILNSTYTVVFTQKENKSTHFINYFPPPNTHNFNILYQVFRI
ncbi:MAG: HYC_CC_PP family protein [Lutibacter sp.]